MATDEVRTHSRRQTESAKKLLILEYFLYIQSNCQSFGRVRLFAIPSTLCDPWAVARQVPLLMEFSRQEYWSGLPFPSPRYLPNIGIKTGPSALQADSLPSETLGTQSIRGTNMSFQSPNSSSWNNRSDFECPDQLIISLVHFRIDTLPEFLSIENGFLGYN